MVCPGEVPRTRKQRMLVASSGTHMVYYEQDLEDVYLQSIPIVLAYNKVNHYTATKLISQQEFQSWKIQQCCMLGQNFIKSASIVNKQFVSEVVSTKLEGCVSSIKEFHSLLSDLKNQTIVSLCVTHILPSCGYFKGQEQICFNPTSWHLVTYNFLRGHKF